MGEGLRRMQNESVLGQARHSQKWSVAYWRDIEKGLRGNIAFLGEVGPLLQRVVLGRKSHLEVLSQCAQSWEWVRWGEGARKSHHKIRLTGFNVSYPFLLSRHF